MESQYEIQNYHNKIITTSPTDSQGPMGLCSKKIYDPAELIEVLVWYSRSPTVLMPMLGDSFPYMTKHSYLQACYVTNLLQITAYLPKQRPQILLLIVDKMTKLDVSNFHTCTGISLGMRLANERHVRWNDVSYWLGTYLNWSLLVSMNAS